MNNIIKLLKKDDTFGVVVSENDFFCLNGIQQNAHILELYIDNVLKPKPLLTQADPFLLVKDDILYLFYESQRSGEKGVICMKKTSNLYEWSEPIVVLREHFHLSFPFVFIDNGEVYMIPESQEVNSVRLYKGNQDMTSFSLERVLLTRKRTNDMNYSFSDSHVIKLDNIYYLFTSVVYNWTYYLELYYTDNLLLHNFVKHPKSPIYIGNDFGRSGGAVISYNGNYYRISQNCSSSYGANISIHQIKQIDKRNYCEELFLKDILRTNGEFYRDGGHQLSIAKFHNKYVYATDYRRLSWSWYQQYLKLKNVIKKV